MHSYVRYLEWARYDGCPSLEFAAAAIAMLDCYHKRGFDPHLPPALADSYLKGWKMALQTMPNRQRLTLAFSS